jgi:hypothetical protein
MNVRRTLLGLLTSVVVTGTAIVAAPAAQGATQAGAQLGTTSLASVLAADGSRFDRNWNDYDILDNAVHAVLAAKPTSPVAVLADGTVPLTAFLPNDRAFQLLALSVTHRWYGSEQGVFTALAGALGIDTIEKVLLYHVVPGVTIDAATALTSNGAVLPTALAGASIKVRVLSKRFGLIQLVDGNRRNIDPFVNPFALNLNKGNRQIAHGITFVLLPS